MRFKAVFRAPPSGCCGPHAGPPCSVWGAGGPTPRGHPQMAPRRVPEAPCRVSREGGRPPQGARNHSKVHSTG
eukprot:10193267-Alexandrium_andersonii.AAC.1